MASLIVKKAAELAADFEQLEHNMVKADRILEELQEEKEMVDLLDNANGKKVLQALGLRKHVEEFKDRLEKAEKDREKAREARDRVADMMDLWPEELFNAVEQYKEDGGVVRSSVGDPILDNQTKNDVGTKIKLGRLTEADNLLKEYKSKGASVEVVDQLQKEIDEKRERQSLAIDGM